MKDNIFEIYVRKVYYKLTDMLMRFQLKNQDFSLICPTCIGGVISHHLGKQFLSPTINLWLTENDFYKFVMDLKWYIDSQVEYSHRDSIYDFPVGVIHGRYQIPEQDVFINFNHHKVFEEAVADWDKRKQRINWDNIYVIASTRGNCESRDKIERWGNAYYIAKGVVCFTAGDYPDIPFALQLKAFKERDCCGSYMTEAISKYFKKLSYERDFDYVRWLNTGVVK